MRRRLRSTLEEAELVQADVFVCSKRRGPSISTSFSSPSGCRTFPYERFDQFWGSWRSALRPGGRVFLVDSGAGDTAHTGTDLVDGEETRLLADGRTFRIFKRRWPPARLAALVQPLGFELDLHDSANGHFLYGGGVLT